MKKIYSILFEGGLYFVPKWFMYTAITFHFWYTGNIVLGIIFTVFLTIAVADFIKKLE